MPDNKKDYRVMAITINRICSDGAQFATVEIVSTGEVGGESGTIIDVSRLTGWDGNPNPQVRLVKIFSSVAGQIQGMNLIWGGPDTEFLTIWRGLYISDSFCSPVDGFDGIIKFDSPGDTPFTLHLTFEKLTGFPGSMAKINQFQPVDIS
jgi:hypothetical protein